MDFVAMAAAAMITGASIAPTASAHESDQRLRPITFQLRPSNSGDPAMEANLASLSPRDDAATRRRRRAAWVLVGPVTLSLAAARLRSARTDLSALPADRLSSMSVAGAIGIDLGARLSLNAFAGTTRVRRRFAALPSLRALGSDEVVLGTSLARPGIGTVNAEYRRIGMRGRRDAAMRIAERISGQTSAGYGPQLAFTNAVGDERSGEIRWTLSAAAFRRDAADLGLSAPSGTVADRRVELAMRIAL